MSLWAAILPAHIHPAADPDAALDHALQTVVLEPATPQQQRRDAAVDLVGDPDTLGRPEGDPGATVVGCSVVPTRLIAAESRLGTRPQPPEARGYRRGRHWCAVIGLCPGRLVKKPSRDGGARSGHACAGLCAVPSSNTELLPDIVASF